jgi:hypothetical protein
VLVALVSNGFTAALIVLGIVLLVQQLEGNVLQPILQGKSLNLHAAVVLLAVAAGGTLYGIAGAFLAVPVTAAAATVLRYLLAQVDRISEDGVTDAPADPQAADAAGVPPAPDGPGGDHAHARGSGAGPAADPDEAAEVAVDPPGVARPGADGVGAGEDRSGGDRAGAVPEPRPDAPNPEQLELADDPVPADPESERRRLRRG